MMLTLVGEKGSARSKSGLVALPSNEVGLVVKVADEESEESEPREYSDSDRCKSQIDRLNSAGVSFV